MSDEVGETPGPAGPEPGVDVERRVEIHNRPVNVVLVGPAATPLGAFGLRRAVMGELRAREVEAGGTGFQAEQSNEGLHDGLPGGWIR